jgi:hypothetical protein
MKFRGAVFVGEQVLLTAMTQNIKRMVKLLTSRRPKPVPAKVGDMSSSSVNASYRLAHWIFHLMQAKLHCGFLST